MIRAVKIKLARVEAPTEAGGEVEVAGEDVWAQAGRVLADWSVTAPTGLETERTDYTITYADGFTYSGRFALSAYDSDLVGHLRGYLRFVTRHCAHGSAETHRVFAEHYDLGPRT